MMLDRMLTRDSNNHDESDTNMEHELCNPWKSMMNKLVYDQQSKRQRPLTDCTSTQSAICRFVQHKTMVSWLLEK